MRACTCVREEGSPVKAGVFHQRPPCFGRLFPASAGAWGALCFPSRTVGRGRCGTISFERERKTSAQKKKCRRPHFAVFLLHLRNRGAPCFGAPPFTQRRSHHDHFQQNCRRRNTLLQMCGKRRLLRLSRHQPCGEGAHPRDSPTKRSPPTTVLPNAWRWPSAKPSLVAKSAWPCSDSKCRTPTFTSSPSTMRATWTSANRSSNCLPKKCRRRPMPSARLSNAKTRPNPSTRQFSPLCTSTTLFC